MGLSTVHSSILHKLGAIVTRPFLCSSLKGHCLQGFLMKQEEKSSIFKDGEKEYQDL